MYVRKKLYISRQRKWFLAEQDKYHGTRSPTPDPSLSATPTHYTHLQISLMVSRNTTLVPFLGCALGQPVRQASALACEGSVCHPK